MKQSRLTLLIIISLFILLSACGGDTPNNIQNNSNDANVSDSIIPTDEPDTPLTVCIADLPNTLKPFDNPNPSAQLILQTLTDGPIDSLNYTDYSPTILESIPSLEDASAFVQPVDVQLGQTVLTDNDQVKPLDHGLRVRPAGCTDSDCAIFYDGGSLQMDQLSASFSLKPNVTWQDGTPLTAHDSVFGFTLNTLPDIPADKFKTDRTASYIASDDTTAIWTGIPGFLDPDYQFNFWPPAPQHLWGELTPAEVNAAAPVSYGPFILTNFSSEEITLEPNPYYHRSDEGLPLATSLTFRIVGSDPQTNLDLIQNGTCDILGPTASANIDPATLIELEVQDQLQTHWSDAGSWELINFGIQPISYDNGYRQVSGDRPNFFGNVRTRQAIAQCINRQEIIKQVYFSKTGLMHTYVPPSHPLANPDATQHPYNPTAAASLLDQAGWVLRPDSIRVASGIPETFDSEPFEISYFFLDNPKSEQVAQMVAQDLAACGIKVNLASGTAEELFTPGPDGLLFGRQFDLAQFSWQTAAQPSCHLFLSEAIPGDDPSIFPYVWGGWNLTGWSNPEFDTACKATQSTLPGQDGYRENHALAQAIFAEELPVIPLFTHQQFIVTRSDLCGIKFSSGYEFLSNIEEIVYGSGCP